jgi:hypothetical protein
MDILHASPVSNVLPTFDQWVEQQGITHATDVEASYRRMVFNQNILNINAHNKDPTQTYILGVNHFTATTQN